MADLALRWTLFEIGLLKAGIDDAHWADKSVPFPHNGLEEARLR